MKNQEKEKPPEEAPETWPQRLRRWGIQLALFGALYAGVLLWMNWSLLPNGQAAPAFALSSLEGKQVALSQFAGKRVIVHFWATWCGACKMNIPIMRALASGYKDDPVLLTVVTDGRSNPTTTRQIARAKKINYPVLLATPRIARSWKVQRYPTTYFIDNKGRIVSKDSGVITPFGFWWRGIWLWLRGSFASAK